jgi:uncharacterized protein (TIGR02271 family)
MAQTVNVVGLFETQDEASRVVQELVTSGFGRQDIRLLTGNMQGAASDLVSETMSLGAPRQDAQFYAQGVQSGGTLVVLQTTEDRADEALAIMDRLGARHMADQNLQAASTQARQGEAVIPVVEEELQVGKRAVQRGGVRVYTRVAERPVEESVRLREEHVTVERRPVDRPVTEADRAAFQEGAIELTETAEQAVVSKQARVVEEVVVGKEATERTETVRDTVRRTDVDVQQVGAEQAGGTSGFDAYDADFRSNFQSTFAGKGATYEQYAPAYRYGYDLARHPQYSSGDWAEVEPEARRSWEQKNAGTWEQFKDVVRHAWDKVRGQR